VKIYNFKKNSKIKGDFGGFQLPEGEREREREREKKRKIVRFLYLVFSMLTINIED
jgi:hypothetical protein